MSTKKLSRRDFLKLAGVGLSAIAFNPFNVRNLPTLRQVRSWLADPEFFRTRDAFGRRIVVPQEDWDEFDGDKNLYGFRNNFCPYAMLAALTKLYGFLYTGQIPDVEMVDILNNLRGKQVIDKNDWAHPIVDWDYSVYFDGLGYAIENYLDLGQYVTTELLTTDWGGRYIQFVNQTEWEDLFARAEAICNKGGTIIVFGIKHKAGHFVPCTDFKSADGQGEVVVLDSFDATVYRTRLKTWFGSMVTDPDNKRLGPQRPLLGLLGLIPKYEFPDLGSDLYIDSRIN